MKFMKDIHLSESRIELAPYLRRVAELYLPYLKLKVSHMDLNGIHDIASDMRFKSFYKIKIQ